MFSVGFDGAIEGAWKINELLLAHIKYVVYYSMYVEYDIGYI